MCYFPPSFSPSTKSFGSASTTTVGMHCSTCHPGLSATCCAISTCNVRRRSCSKSFAACGMNSSTRREMAQRPMYDRPPQRSSDVFESATSRSTKTRTLPFQRHSSSLPTIMIPFYIASPHILCAASKPTTLFLSTQLPTVPTRLLT